MLRATLAILLACLLSGCTDAQPALVSLDSVDRGIPEHTHEQAPAAADADSAHAAPEAAASTPAANRTHDTPAANRTEGTPAGNVTGDATDGAGNGTSPYDDPAVVVAVLDNGIEPDHEAFAEGQVVAWYDFGRDGRPDGVPSETWDPAVEPYARNDHGPATASMVGGGGAGQTASHARGVALAVGQVALNDKGGTSWQDLADAIHWAVDTVGADVISISKYRHAPEGPPTDTDKVLLDALEYARAAGVLPVVLAGNGYGNGGDPTFSWLHAPATSAHALIVGGAHADGGPVAPEGSMDPEVTAAYAVTAACKGTPDAPDCYREVTGTSFSTPLVAGMAAAMLQHAHDLDVPLDADRTEDVLKGCARGTDAAPAFEGYGFLDAAGLDCALRHVADGTTPEFDPVDHAYVDGVGAAERGAWSGDAAPEAPDAPEAPEAPENP